MIVNDLIVTYDPDKYEIGDFLKLNKEYKVFSTYNDRVEEYLILNDREFLNFYPTNKFKIIH